MTDPQIIQVIHAGKGRMPAFPKLPSDELAAPAALSWLAPGLSVAAAPISGGSSTSSSLVDAGEFALPPKTARSVMDATRWAEKPAPT